jgi:hypothetical protein
MQQNKTVRQVVTPYGVANVPVSPTTNMAETKLTKQQQEEHVRIQREAAKRTLAIQGDREQRSQDAHINAEATTDTHVGLAPGDKTKPKSMEALKTDLKDVTGSPDVHRAALKTPGKGTTDLVTTSPKGARPGGGGKNPKSHTQRAQEAAEAGAKTSGKKKRGGKKKAGATEQAAE